MVARTAGLSRATVYRHFRSKAELLAALDLEPEPGTRERVLEAAAELVSRHGLNALSMDELAATAGVSRASVYRLFSGKAALFEALVETHSPFELVTATLERLRDRPPEEVLPEVVRAAARVAAPRVGILRTLLFQVMSGSPEAVEGYGQAIQGVLVTLGEYLSVWMTAGRLRPMNPLLAAQTLMGPLILFLLTRPLAGRLPGLEMSFEAAVEELAMAALRSLKGPSSGEGR